MLVFYLIKKTKQRAIELSQTNKKEKGKKTYHKTSIEIYDGQIQNIPKNATLIPIYSHTQYNTVQCNSEQHMRTKTRS